MNRRTSIRRRKSAYPSAAQEAERRAWSEQWDRCWICGQRWDLQTHELGSKARAPLKWADVRNYFMSCGICNCNVLNHLPESLQLAYKRHFDPENYDRQFVNEIRGRAPDAISEGDVRQWKDFVKQVSK